MHMPDVPNKQYKDLLCYQGYALTCHKGLCIGGGLVSLKLMKYSNMTVKFLLNLKFDEKEKSEKKGTANQKDDYNYKVPLSKQ